MCKKKSLASMKTFTSIGSVDPFLGNLLGVGISEGWFDDIHSKGNDEWLRTYDDAHFLGGGLLAKVQGLEGREVKRAERAADARERALTPNPAPIAPEQTAMLVNPANELRDRRRRAILMARTNLSQPGPGANIPLG